MTKLPVAIVGAGTRVGAELARLCSSPSLTGPSLPGPTVSGGAAPGWLELRAATAEPHGPGLEEAEPVLAELAALPADAAVFLAVRRGRGQELALALLARGMRVIDLSGDHVLDEDEYAEAYPGLGPHRHPRLIARAAAGLCELHGGALRGARLVAMPSPGAAAALLALGPLAVAGLISTDRAVVFIAAADDAVAGSVIAGPRGAVEGQAGPGGARTVQLHDSLRLEIARGLRRIAPGAARVSCARLDSAPWPSGEPDAAPRIFGAEPSRDAGERREAGAGRLADASGDRGAGLIAIAMADLASPGAAEPGRLRLAYQQQRAASALLLAPFEHLDPERTRARSGAAAGWDLDGPLARLCAEGEAPDAGRVRGTGAAEVFAFGDAWAERVTACCALDPVPWAARAALRALRACTSAGAGG